MQAGPLLGEQCHGKLLVVEHAGLGLRWHVILWATTHTMSVDSSYKGHTDAGLTARYSRSKSSWKYACRTACSSRNRVTQSHTQRRATNSAKCTHRVDVRLPFSEIAEGADDLIQCVAGLRQLWVQCNKNTQMHGHLCTAANATHHFHHERRELVEVQLVLAR